MIMSLARQAGGSGTAHLPSGTAVWGAARIEAGAAPAKGTATASAGGGSPGRQRLGDVYVEVPATARGAGGISVSWPLILAGLLVLGLSVPVGIVFGLLSTRRLTRRLKRLAASTLEVAGGAFEQRIPVAGRDELGQLEENFNRMAERLHASLETERKLAAANGRHKERSRIARELHDSISQDLFSLSVLAGGLRRALPPGSPVLAQVATMERTAGDTMREMQVLTSSQDDAHLVQAIRAGALTYLPKTADVDQVVASVRAAARGESVLQPAATARLLKELRRGSAADPLGRLTPRERDVLTEVARGRSNREIARALSVSEETVKSHVSSILAKLGLADRTQAAIFGLQRQLVPLGEALDP
jgi:DNA-binding NarL/FixJ family response regulator/HAMP domain-containing protein